MSELWLPEAESVVKQNWIRVVKMYKLPVINKYWDVMYKMIELQYCMLYMKAVKRVNPKSSHHRNKNSLI